MEVVVVLVPLPLPAKFILGPGRRGLIPEPALIRLGRAVVLLASSAGLPEDSSFEASASVDGAAVVRPLALPMKGLFLDGGDTRLIEAAVVLESALPSSGAAVVRTLDPARPPKRGRV